MRYEFLMYWSEVKESLVGEVPELPGCRADGATCEEAVANTRVVVNE